MNGLFSKVGILAGLAAALSLPASAGTTTYQIDPRHSSAGFGVTHLMISTVRGEFHGVTGTVVIDDSDVSKSTVSVTIDATTVDTREPDRDKHLKSEAFFDVSKFPTITFQSTKIERNNDGSLKITGDLTIRGVTREIELDVTLQGRGMDPWGNERAGFEAKGKINRTDFGLTWNQALEAGGVVVGEDVKLSIDVELVKQAVAKAA